MHINWQTIIRNGAPELTSILDRQGFVALLARMFSELIVQTSRANLSESHLEMHLASSHQNTPQLQSGKQDIPVHLIRDRLSAAQLAHDDIPSVDQIEIFILGLQTLGPVEHVVLESEPSPSGVSQPPVGGSPGVLPGDVSLASSPAHHVPEDELWKLAPLIKGLDSYHD